jgi:cell wall assembly regulator SMI1
MNVEHYFAEVRRLALQQGVALNFEPGASDTLLFKVEQELGFRLEEVIRQAWLAHNGGEEWQSTFARPGFLESYAFLSLGQAMEEREKLKQRSSQYGSYKQPKRRDKRILDGWFQAGWLPFASFGGSSLLLIQDYSPAATGSAGQIIAFKHDPDSINYVSESFASFLPKSLETLRADPEEFFQEE